MEYIFHEIQDGALCAQHCLNSLLQGDYFTAVDLAQIAEQLDSQERAHMSEAGTATKEYEHFLSQGSSNYDDSGFFSIQVLQKAVFTFSLDLVPFSSQNPLAIQARKDPISLKAFVCNFKEHWYTIRKIGKYWFNLNSMSKGPELISETYLSILLYQLVKDGYSIFIVDGDLPQNVQAESKLLENPLDSKQILASSYTKRIAKSHQEFDDEDLKSAIKRSLIENDMDLDSKAGVSDIQYPSLAVDMQHSQDDDLKKAIELSLAVNAARKSQEDVVVLTPNELRDKRLKRFETAEVKTDETALSNENEEEVIKKEVLVEEVSKDVLIEEKQMEVQVEETKKVVQVEETPKEEKLNVLS